MNFALSARSNARLDQAHPDLKRVVEHAITITPIDFTVTETLRTLKRQQELVSIGASKTLDSRHLAHPSDELSRAVDLAPLFKGRSYWIPGSWNLRTVYTDDISCRDPSQESNRAGQHQESRR